MGLSSFIQQTREVISLLVEKIKNPKEERKDPYNLNLWLKVDELFDSLIQGVKYSYFAFFGLLLLFFISLFLTLLFGLSDLFLLFFTLIMVLLMFVVYAEFILVISLVIIILLIRPPRHVRMAHFLSVVKEEIQSKTDVLTLEDKSRISKKLSDIIDVIPRLLKNSKTGLSELDEELSKRFSSMKKVLVDISKNIYFATGMDYKNIISDIERISQTIKDRDYGKLELDPQYRPPNKERFWIRWLNWPEFQKNITYVLVLFLGSTIFILLLVSIKKLDPQLYKDIITIIRLPLGQ